MPIFNVPYLSKSHLNGGTTVALHVVDRLLNSCPILKPIHAVVGLLQCRVVPIGRPTSRRVLVRIVVRVVFALLLQSGPVLGTALNNVPENVIFAGGLY